MKYRKLLIITIVITSVFFVAANILSYSTHSKGTFTMNDLFNEVKNWLGMEADTPNPESNGTSILKTHPWLTLRAIQLFETKYGNLLNKEQEIAIIQGSIEEDYDIEGTASGIYDNVGIDDPLPEYTALTDSNRCWNHFMDANGNGLVFSALQWATTAVNNNARYSEAETLAKSGQTDSDKLLGWRYLGHVLHLLQDMSVPAHVRADMHPFKETYELELRKLNITDYCNKVGDCNMSNLGEPKIIMTTEPEPKPDQYFIQLADDTRNNFYSENSFTFELDSLPSNIVACPDEQYLCNSNVGNGKIYVADKNSWMNSLRKMPSSLVPYYKITDKVAASMFSYLGLQAVQYGAGLIKLFYDETKPACVPTNADCIYNTCSTTTCNDGCSLIQGVRDCSLTIKGWGEIAPY